MKRFITSNLTWIYRYFDRNKSLLEIFSFLVVALSFMYGASLNDLPAQSVSAFKIILWLLTFLVILLLQISTAVEIQRDDGTVSGRIFAGANFMKVVMRLLMLVLLLLLVGALPHWGYSRSWGYYPSGGLGLILIILLVLLFLGYIPHTF